MLGGFFQPPADGILIQAHDAGGGSDAIPFHQAGDGTIEGFLIGLQVEEGSAPSLREGPATDLAPLRVVR